MTPSDSRYPTGLMMDCPLTVTAILRRAALFYPEKEIVTRLSDGSIHRTTYGAFYRRVMRLMNALRALGVRPGDRIATFAWNSYRHLELYFAVPCLGAILHTINIRLYAGERNYILRHAEDRFIFADRSLAGTLAESQQELPNVETYVLMDDLGTSPETLPTPFLDYEELLAAASETEDFPTFDENTASSLCYTSGTTGVPKGVLYSHRSTYLHAMGCCMTDTFGIGEREVVLPAVPMFHANAWGIPYACALSGAKIIFPGSGLLGKPLADLLEQEGATLSAGVPTVWNLLYQHLKQSNHDLSRLKTVLCGGSAMPQSMIENYARDFGITLVGVWGMTEMSPLGSTTRLKKEMEDWSPEAQSRVRIKQGIPAAPVELQILDAEDRPLAWDGVQAGELVVRGPWVTRGYYGDPSPTSLTADGWFRTGDIVTIDPYGYIEVTDRIKDVIKSRGEWISSVAMENRVVGHPGVLEAAVVGRPDPLRDEAPVVFVVLRSPNETVTPKDILHTLKAHFARWQMPHPSDIHFVESLPKTGVGKLDKKALRQRLAEAKTRGNE